MSRIKLFKKTVYGRTAAFALSLLMIVNSEAGLLCARAEEIDGADSIEETAVDMPTSEPAAQPESAAVPDSQPEAEAAQSEEVPDATPGGEQQAEVLDSTPAADSPDASEEPTIVTEPSVEDAAVVVPEEVD